MHGCIGQGLLLACVGWTRDSGEGKAQRGQREREERRDRRCHSAHTWLAASVSVTKKAVKLALVKHIRYLSCAAASGLPSGRRRVCPGPPPCSRFFWPRWSWRKREASRSWRVAMQAATTTSRACTACTRCRRPSRSNRCGRASTCRVRARTTPTHACSPRQESSSPRARRRTCLPTCAPPRWAYRAKSSPSKTPSSRLSTCTPCLGPSAHGR